MRRLYRTMERSPSDLWEEMDRLFSFLYFFGFRMRGILLSRSSLETRVPSGFSVEQLERMGYRTVRLDATIRSLVELAFAAKILEILRPKPRSESGPCSLRAQSKERFYAFSPKAIASLELVTENVTGSAAYEHFSALRRDSDEYLPALELLEARATVLFDWIAGRFLPNMDLHTAKQRTLATCLENMGVLAPIYVADRRAVCYQVVQKKLRQVLRAFVRTHYVPKEVNSHLAIAADLLFQARYGAAYSEFRYQANSSSAHVVELHCKPAAYRAFLEWVAARRAFTVNRRTCQCDVAAACPVASPSLLWHILRDLVETCVLKIEASGKEHAVCTVNRALLQAILAAIEDPSLAEAAVLAVNKAQTLGGLVYLSAQQMKLIRKPRISEEKYHPDLQRVYVASFGAAFLAGVVRSNLGWSSAKRLQQCLVYGVRTAILSRETLPANNQNGKVRFRYHWKRVPVEWIRKFGGQLANAANVPDDGNGQLMETVEARPLPTEQVVAKEDLGTVDDFSDLDWREEEELYQW